MAFSPKFSRWPRGGSLQWSTPGAGDVLRREFFRQPGVAPTITVQPTDQSGTVGGTVTFTGAATGVPAVTYQWQVLKVS